MTEGELCHRLMQARELTDRRPDLADVRLLLDAALQLARRVHRER